MHAKAGACTCSDLVQSSDGHGLSPQFEQLGTEIRKLVGNALARVLKIVYAYSPLGWCGPVTRQVAARESGCSTRVRLQHASLETCAVPLRMIHREAKLILYTPTHARTHTHTPIREYQSTIKTVTHRIRKSVRCCSLCPDKQRPSMRGHAHAPRSFMRNHIMIPTEYCRAMFGLERSGDERHVEAWKTSHARST
jgi:hypothetical protein